MNFLNLPIHQKPLYGIISYESSYVTSEPVILYDRTLQFYYQLLKYASSMTYSPYQILWYYNHLLRLSMAEWEDIISTPIIGFFSLVIVFIYY